MREYRNEKNFRYELLGEENDSSSPEKEKRKEPIIVIFFSFSPVFYILFFSISSSRLFFLVIPLLLVTSLYSLTLLLSGSRWSSCFFILLLFLKLTMMWMLLRALFLPSLDSRSDIGSRNKNLLILRLLFAITRRRRRTSFRSFLGRLSSSWGILFFSSFTSFHLFVPHPPFTSSFLFCLKIDVFSCNQRNILTASPSIELSVTNVWKRKEIFQKRRNEEREIEGKWRDVRKEESEFSDST